VTTVKLFSMSGEHDHSKDNYSMFSFPCVPPPGCVFFSFPI